MCSRRHGGGRVRRKQISRKTVARRLRGGGLYARRPVVCVPLARQHHTAHLQWCREHHNWTEQDWACVLFSEESRFSLSSDCRRQLMWRESGTAYRPENIQEKDRYPTCSIMVWAGIMINGHTRLHVVANGTLTGQRYIHEVLLPHVRLFRGAVGDKFVFMDDNATCQRTLAVQDCLDSEGIQRLVWPVRSPDLNPIENVWDALGRQVAGRNYPPTNKNTLIRALTEEWDKLPQQLLDNVVQKVGKLIDENSACVEVGTTHKHLRRGDKSNNFKNYFSSNDITCEEVKSVDSQRFFFIGYIVRASNKGAREKKKLAKLEKEIELQLAKNKALSLNPAAKVEEKQFETNIENMIKSIKTLSLPVPTRSENFNLFFQSLERAFLTKKINDEYKSEILINLLGERAHNVLLYIKEEELNDYEKLKSIVLREFQLTPRECLNSFKNAVKSSGETYIQFAARLTANFQYYCSLRKVNSFESLCDLIISDKLFETLNKETATHIGIREAEDWLRPIDLAKECDIYISSKNGSHKETPITYGYTQDPFKNRSQNFKPKIKENYPQYLERENKNCYICGDSSHCARDCEKRFKPKESNDHIHNRINVNTLKIESEKQNSDECANLQYVNIFVENQPVTALIDSGCQIPVLNSSLIRVQTPSEEIITLSSCFGEQRMVEVKPINISLNQQSPSLSVRTAISPTLTEEFIIHPSVYSEIEKLGHAKSDVLLSESGSSLSADLGVQFNSSVSFPNVSVSNVIKNCSYDLPYVKNFNTRNDSSSLIKDYKCNKIKSTKLKLSIVREKCSDIVLCKKANGAMKTSSVEFISRSPNPLPMKSKHHRFVLLRRIFQPWQWKRRKKRNRFEQTSRTLQRKISMRSTKDQLIKKDVLMPVKHNVFLWNLPDVEEVPSHDGETV
ncbi:transposable element Tcb2 transposase [Trichonephila clavipes]|nr:transposable element Tcb2 transposase [Trichonephila clavipes]